jgi:hypothetical protein
VRQYSRQVWNLPHGLCNEKYAVLGAFACPERIREAERVRVIQGADANLAR